MSSLQKTSILSRWFIIVLEWVIREKEWWYQDLYYRGDLFLSEAATMRALQQWKLVFLERAYAGRLPQWHCCSKITRSANWRQLISSEPFTTASDSPTKWTTGEASSSYEGRRFNHSPRITINPTKAPPSSGFLRQPLRAILFRRSTGLLRGFGLYV